MLVQVKFAKVLTLQYIRLTNYGTSFWKNIHFQYLALHIELIGGRVCNEKQWDGGERKVRSLPDSLVLNWIESFLSAVT